MVFIRRLINEIKHNYIALKYLINEEKANNSKISIFKRIWCLFHGFSSSKFELYNFKENDYRLFLSDFKRRKTAKINGLYSLIINDKSVFSEIYSEYTPIVYGKVENGNIKINNYEYSFDEFLSFLESKEKLIIKKYRGGGGKDIYRTIYHAENLYLNDSPVKPQELKDFLSGLTNYLIMEHLSQLDYSNRIYSGTINSIRIITMLDPYTNKPFIPIAIHKFGSDKTKPADNVWKGGMTALVDLETGRLGKPAYHQENNNKITWKHNHPDSNEKIEGTKIPNWQKTKDQVLKVALKNTHLKYVGWDVVVTEDGIKVIEGNNYSDVNILQIHQPLLVDNRVKEFYKYHGII